VSHDDAPSVRGSHANDPTSARAYGWLLGGKDNYEADREFVRRQLQSFPAGLDITRQNLWGAETWLVPLTCRLMA
jgi:hypothetical protein